jgi:hypothetical protein
MRLSIFPQGIEEVLGYLEEKASKFVYISTKSFLSLAQKEENFEFRSG